MKTRPYLMASIVLMLLFVQVGASHSRDASTCDKGTPSGWFYFSSDPHHGSCSVQLEPAVDTVSVMVYANPFKTARFTVTDPPFGSVIAESWLFPHTGDRQNGLELDMGSCATQPGTFKLGELYVLVGPEVDPALCMSWAEGKAEIENCVGTWLPAKFTPQWAHGPNSECPCPTWQYCYSLPPYDLLPEEGATGVPTNVVLSWVAPEGWDQFNSGCYVFISTDPSCATFQRIQVPCDNDTFAPDFLQPGTTYYWASSWATDTAWGCYGYAAYQSFTTAPVSAVEPTTWGRVKAMYRR